MRSTGQGGHLEELAIDEDEGEVDGEAGDVMMMRAGGSGGGGGGSLGFPQSDSGFQSLPSWSHSSSVDEWEEEGRREGGTKGAREGGRDNGWRGNGRREG